MKSVICKRDSLWMILLCVLAILAPAAAVANVPGQISFQGYLTDDDGAPVPDDTYTMHFYLFDAPTGGIQLWNAPDGEGQAVDVTDGIYNVQLGAFEPLDSSVFDGGVAWLQVVVEGETLSPRQRITAAAYALKAGDADTFEGNAVVDLDARYVNEDDVGVVTSSMIADSTIGAADLGANSVGASEIAGSAVGSGEVANNSLTAADLAADSVGNSELAPNSVGSAEIIDGQVTAADLQDGAARAEILDDDGAGSGLDADLLDGYTSGSFVLTGQDYGRYNVAANLYEGTSTLTSKYVNQTGDSMSGTLSISKPGLGLWINADPYGGTLYGLQLDVDQSSTNNYTTYGIYNYVDSLASTASVYGNFTHADKDAGTGSLYGDYQQITHRGTGGSTYGYYAMTYGSDVSDVYGISTYASKTSSDTGGVAYGGRFHADNDDSGTGYGVYGLSNGTSGYNYGVFGTASGGSYNYGGYFSSTGSNGRGVFASADGDNAFAIQAYAYSNGTGEDDGRGVYGGAYGPDAVGGYFFGSGTGAVGIYAQGTSYAADFNGNVRIRSGSTTVMELGQGLDYAEGFDVSDMEKPTPGSVLIIDPDNPGKLALSTTTYDTKVAGIVAGANGLGSGVRLGGDQFDNDVALAGRVYCKVDATNTAVKTGDLLTTADLPGYAMKAGDYARAQGAILGKAMQDLEQGQKGQILVLVTLQ